MQDKETGYSFGFGFIEYVEGEQDGERACQLLNGLQLEHKRIKVTPARPQSNQTRNTTLYVKGFPNQFNEKQLADLFSPFGDIVQTRILKDKQVGFVIMGTRTQAEQARNKLNSDTITVKFTDPLSKRRQMARKRDFRLVENVNPYPTTIYVYGIGQRPNQYHLYWLFSLFGRVLRVDIIVDLKTGLSKGYAFILMEDLNSAQQAIFELDNIPYNGRHLQVRLKNNKNSFVNC